MVPVLVVEHPRGGSPGNFIRVASVMRRKLVRHSFADGGIPDPEQFSALVVLGGLENVDEQESYPYLADELKYMKDWLETDKPVLGICLGAQLLSLAAGGSAEEMGEAEIGWHPFYHEESARLDSVLTRVDEQIALQWHSYTALPPSEAKILARNDYGVQAFRLDRAWGMQFHPEGNQETVARWCQELKERGDEEKIVHLEDGLKRNGPAWRRYGCELFGRFLALSES